MVKVKLKAIQSRELKSIPKQSRPELNKREQMKTLNQLFKDFEPMGSGAHGKVVNVYKCKHRLSNQVCTVKIISISKQEKKNGVPYRIMREVAVLRELDHFNIVRLIDVIPAENAVFLVFEYLNSDLHSFLKDPKMILDPKKIREYAYQILDAVAYIHSCKILHRGLNTQNILIHFETRFLKIADFGAARTFELPPESYSQNVGTLSYRAPELLFGSTNYSTQNDVWSVGCIFGEMVLRQQLFAAASNWEVLDEIFNLLGTPTEETWPGVTSLCGGDISVLGPPKEPKNLRYVFPTLDPVGLDLLSKLLCLCPNKRISAEDAVMHPYFKGI